MSEPSTSTPAVRTPKVVRLSDTLISQIAAGEVIERPASVVKELVENAVDAGSRKIEVELVDGGLTQISVFDDGCGMSPEDAETAVERHATSKLRTHEDLFKLHTLGFRGEALPSIASVSRFELTTREANALAAVMVTVIGGDKQPVRQAAMAPGTRIIISDLFFNQPARKKFQKSPSTEQTHCVAAVLRIALACPSVRFVVRAKGRTLLDIPAVSGDPRDRIAAALTRDLRDKLYPVEFAREDGGVTVSGYVADPDQQAGDARHMYCYVNGRYVKDRLLQRALLEGYRSLLPHGRYPTAVLFVDVAPGEVDVNVHPQKFEVRFTNSQSVFSSIVRGVADVLARTPWLERGGATLSGRTEPSNAPLAQIRAGSFGRSSFSVTSEIPAVESRRAWNQLFDSQVAPRLASQLGSAATETLGFAPGHASEPPLSLIEASQRADLFGTGFFSRQRVLSQFANLYILCEGDQELVVVDQHAAHERITFEKLLNAWEAGRVPEQRLLFPITIETRPDVLQLVEENAPVFERLGLQAKPFGETTLAITSIPAVTSEKKARGLMDEIVAELSEARGVASAEFAHALLARVACHSSVRSGDPLTMPEMQALLREMDTVDCSIRCPHGRPVVARVRLDAIGRWFERA